MKKKMLLLFLAVLAIGLTAMAAHKYYVAVFHFELVPEKKVIRITSRAFIDDIEAALSKKYNKKFYLSSSRELPDANKYIQMYFLENMHIEINGKAQAIKYLGRETEDDILICYYTMPAATQIKTIKVRNTTLFESFPDQQNYIHTNINRNKKSLLLTNDEQEGTLEF